MEKDGGYELTIDMPGVKKENVKAELNNRKNAVRFVLRGKSPFGINDNLFNGDKSACFGFRQGFLFRNAQKISLKNRE